MGILNNSPLKEPVNIPKTEEKLEEQEEAKEPVINILKQEEKPRGTRETGNKHSKARGKISGKRG